MGDSLNERHEKMRVAISALCEEHSSEKHHQHFPYTIASEISVGQFIMLRTRYAYSDVSEYRQHTKSVAGPVGSPMWDWDGSAYWWDRPDGSWLVIKWEKSWKKATLNVQVEHNEYEDVKFFLVRPCVHEMSEQSVGNYLHRYTCQKCGYHETVDSSG